MRVLIVDDSVTVRDRLVEALSRLPGLDHVHIASSPLEATRAVQSGWPDAVVLDINLPRDAGPQVLDALKTGDSRIVSIVLTNDATQEQREACRLAGADFFFDKSWELQSVVDVIARLARGDVQEVTLPPCWTGFDLLPIPGWLYDLDTFAFRAVNHAAVVRYGYSREEFLAMTLADVQLCGTPPGADPSARLTRHLAGRQQHQDRAGAVLNVEVVLTDLIHDGGRLGVALIHDIGEHVTVERALRASDSRCRELEQKLRQASRLEAIGRLAGAVAQECSNLLTIIMGRSQQLMDSLGPDDPARVEAIGIFEASSVLETKIREVLAASPSNVWRI